jgi:hypothetical protein
VTRQATDNLYIELDYYYPEEYYTYEAEAAGAITAQAAVSCDFDVITPNVEFSADLVSTVTLTAQCNYTVEAVINQLSLFNTSFVANVSVDSGADLSANFVLSASADDITKQVNVTLATIVSLSLQAARLRGTSPALTSTFTQTESSQKYISYLPASPTPFYARGRAYIRSDIKKFGTHSLILDTTTSGAKSSTTHTKFAVGSGDWSLGLWYYPSSQVGTDDIVGFWNGTQGWRLQRLSDNKITFNISNGVQQDNNTTAGSINPSAWNWIQVTKDNTNDLRISINGTVEVYDPNLTVNSGTAAKHLYIGDPDAIGNGSAQGFIDGLEIRNQTRTYTEVPTAHSLAGIPGVTTLLLNWDDSALGNWFDYSETEVAEAAASITTTASLSVVANANFKSSATLNSQSTVVAAGGFTFTTGGSLTSQFTLTCEATEITPTVFLTTTSTLTAQIDDPYLQLVYGAASTSGFITSAGGNIVTQNFVDNSDGPDNLIYYLSAGAYINFWFKVETGIANNSTLRIYTSANGTNRIDLINTAGVYTIRITHANYDYWWKPGFIDYVKYRRTASISIPLADGPFAWTNLNGRLAPVLGQSWSDSGGDPPYPEYAADMIPVWGTYQINGTTVSTATTSTSTSLGLTVPGNDYTPPAYSTVNGGAVNGGQWGFNTNNENLFIDQVWVQNAYTGNVEAPLKTVPPAAQFYSAGNQTAIFGGLTPGGFQADVWLPWRNLNDGASPSPTWNYTATNRVVYGYIKTTEAQLTASTTVVANGRRLALASASFTSSATVSAIGLRIKRGVVTASSISTIVANVRATRRAQSQLTSTATIVATGNKLRFLASALSTNATVASTLLRLRNNTVGITAESTLTCQLDRIRYYDSALSVETTVDATALRIKQISSDFDSVGAVIAAVIYIGNPLVSIQTFSTLDATAQVTTGIQLDCLSESTVTATIKKTTDFRADLISQSTLTVVADKIKIVIAELEATSTLTAGIFKLNGGASDLTAISITDITPLRIREFPTALNTTTTVSVPLVDVLVRYQANLSTVSTILCIAGVSVRFEANLIVQGFTLTAGRVVHIDPDRQLIVPSEQRSKLVIMEIRNIIVPSETRIKQV